MQKQDSFIRMTWWLAVIAVVAYCLLSLFFWSIIDAVTPFIAPFAWLSVLAITLASMIMAIILPFRRWRTHRMTSLAPLGFLVTCFIITRFVDFTALWLTANFKYRHADRLEVVRRIERGEFYSNISHNVSLIALPRQFSSVSLGGGEVMVQRDGDRFKVLFFTFRGILNNFSGFIYTSDGLVPKNGDFTGEFFVNKKIEDRWYYVSAN